MMDNKFPNFSVHGGITFTDHNIYGHMKTLKQWFQLLLEERIKKVWWIGFDTGHTFEELPILYARDDHHEVEQRLHGAASNMKDIEYCVDECQALVDDLILVKKGEYE